jgi:DGQHR domain-containing protein
MNGKRMATKKPDDLIIRALHTLQGDGLDVYAFFMHGADITRVADISRVERDEADVLKGFQRPEIRNHVKSIVEYLSQKNILFPNAIILAISPEIRFAASRGPKPDGLTDVAQSGTLTIPVRAKGQRAAWIVDGQQRSLALAQVKNKEIPVPVIAFVSDELEVQREQFILVNKAKPLPTRLINELLPETRSVLLPRELSSRRIPSELCKLLNRDPQSPFHRLIKRLSEKDSKEAVITDTAVITMIRNSINNPLGALASYKASGNEAADIEGMYNVLTTFWSAVRAVFHDAWGKDTRHSRLMHSAGIEAMGVVMDRMWVRHSGSPSIAVTIKQELEKMAPHCCWTEGTWDSLGLAWNEIQSTPSHIKKLQDALVRIYTTKAATR